MKTQKQQRANLAMGSTPSFSKLFLILEFGLMIFTG